MAAFKMCLWLMVLTVIRLSLWANRIGVVTGDLTWWIAARRGRVRLLEPLAMLWISMAYAYRGARYRAYRC
jgi:hypothetical protein